MQALKRTENTPSYPIKVVQFGEGNFLRAFVDWIIDILNEKGNFNGSVAILQPLSQGMVSMLKDQDGLYHHLRQGIENGQLVDDARLITAVSEAVNPFENINRYFELAATDTLELIFSNTTEAGIVFEGESQPSGQLANTFPAKLTQFLHHRFVTFKGAADKGLSIIPCELIEQNGEKLKVCVNQYIDLWNLGAEFKNWVNESCAFANTLVDRIVPGYPKEEIDSIRERIGYNDQLVVKSETFHLFVIQAPAKVKKAFPAHEFGLNVKYVNDITPYRTQKVRILNGAHTSMVPIGLLYGLETVRETVEHEQVGKIVNDIIFDEIVTGIQIPGEDPAEFAKAVITRFQNPFIRHELISISLNSISKFKVRVLPTFMDYIKNNGKLPEKLTFSLACLIELYLGDKFQIKDNAEYLEFFASIKNSSLDSAVHQVLANTDFWDTDLSKIAQLEETIINHLSTIREKEMVEALSTL